MLSDKELQKWKDKELNAQTLRSEFKGFEHLTDEQAQEILSSLFELSSLAIEMYQQQNGLNHE